MKNLSIKFGLLLFFCTCFFLDGCRQSEIDAVASGPKYLFLKTINYDLVKEAVPELLPRVQKDMLSKNQLKNARRLAETYDFKTGKLKPEAQIAAEELEKGIRSARRLSPTFSYYCNFWAGGALTTLYPNSSNSLSFWSNGWGTSGYRFNVTPTSLPSTWGNASSFCYNAHMAGGSWVGPTAVNNIAGGTSGFMDAFWIWIGSDLATYVYYHAYFTNSGETGWVETGTTCGTPNSGNACLGIEIVMWINDVTE